MGKLGAGLWKGGVLLSLLLWSVWINESDEYGFTVGAGHDWHKVSRNDSFLLHLAGATCQLKSLIEWENTELDRYNSEIMHH